MGSFHNFLRLIGIGSPPVSVVPKIIYRKKSDTRKLNQYHYDFILEAHTQWVTFNLNPDRKGPKKLKKDLVKVINDRFGMSKSAGCYRVIWKHKIQKCDLPVGRPLPPSYVPGDYGV